MASPDEIKELYVKKQLSLRVVADRTGSTPWHVRSTLLDMGVELRHPRARSEWSEERRQEARRLYVTQRLPLAQVAHRLHTTTPQLKRNLQDMGISIRGSAAEPLTAVHADPQIEAFCLARSALGYSLESTAAILGVKRSGVVNYNAHTRSRFGAVSRAHIALSAIEAGWFRFGSLGRRGPDIKEKGSELTVEMFAGTPDVPRKGECWVRISHYRAVFSRGEPVTITLDDKPMHLGPPDAVEASQGPLEGASTAEAVELHRALTAWLQVHRRFHPAWHDAYREQNPGGDFRPRPGLVDTATPRRVPLDSGEAS